MDKIDTQILKLLQQNGNISNQDLADKVALSPSPCSRRVKQLEDEGYIRGYVALLDPKKLGLHLTVIVSVGLNSHDAKKMKEFEKNIEAISEVLECHLIAGQSADYLLKVTVSSMDNYRDFLLNKLTVIDGVDRVHSSFVLQSIINKNALPLD
jgi:Lrp/AsnC family transcriptional regulator, leucine-responsive regulatory protein